MKTEQPEDANDSKQETEPSRKRKAPDNEIEVLERPSKRRESAKCAPRRYRSKRPQTKNSRMFALSPHEDMLQRMHTDLSEWKAEVVRLENEIKSADTAATDFIEYTAKVAPMLQEWFDIERSEADQHTKTQRRDALTLRYMSTFGLEMTTEQISRMSRLNTLDCPTCGAALARATQYERKCRSCGFSRTDFMSSDAESMSFTELQNVTFARGGNHYVRASHFHDLLRLAQGHTRQKMNTDLINRLRALFATENRNMQTLRPQDVRQALHRLNDMQGKQRDFHRPRERVHYIQYYKYAAAICIELNPTFVPVCIAAEDMRTLMRDFDMVERAFEAVRVEVNPRRKSFISYAYVAHQLFVLEGMTQYIDAVPLLKTPELVAELDVFWKAICRHNGWDFFSCIGNVENVVLFASESDATDRVPESNESNNTESRQTPKWAKWKVRSRESVVWSDKTDKLCSIVGWASVSHIDDKSVLMISEAYVRRAALAMSLDEWSESLGVQIECVEAVQDDCTPQSNSPTDSIVESVNANSSDGFVHTDDDIST